MRARKTACLLAAAGMLFSGPSNAWFFFWIPGSLISAVGDALTGAEGNNCVSEATKVGDRFRGPNGTTLIVKSLSGTSGRCQNPERPIRALLEPMATPQVNTNTVAVSPAVTPPPAPVTGAKIDVPDTWEQRPISSAMKAGGAVLHVGSKESDSALVLYTLKRSDVRSPSTFSGMKADAITKTLENGVQSPATTLTINGAKAWQIEISGKTKPADVTVGGTPIAGGVSITYLQTLYEGISEIVGVLSWTNSANYELQKTEFQRVANSLSGIAPTFNLSPAAAMPSERDVALQPAAADSTTARKLRELNDLLKDGLINQQEHAEKRKAILLAM